MNEKFNIWEGSYRNFQEAQPYAIGLGFNGDIYRKRAIDAASECFDALSNKKPIPLFHKQRTTLLAPVAAMMLENKQGLRILDFGGGLGIGYMVLAESIADYIKRINYTIIEVEQICETGRKLFLGNKSINYLVSLPSQEKFDLLYSASALQYVQDWQQVLKSLSGYGAEYILLSDVFAGSIPTFVTLQNYYGSRIRHWFLNFEELLAVILSLGYRLVMKSFVSSLRLGVADILPMDNFPESHRLGQTLHLLLKRDS